MSEIEEIKQTQKQILKILEGLKMKEVELEYVTREEAAKMLKCDKQMLRKWEDEGRLERHGRGRFIRYLVREIKEMMSGKS